MCDKSCAAERQHNADKQSQQEQSMVCALGIPMVQIICDFFAQHETQEDGGLESETADCQK